MEAYIGKYYSTEYVRKKILRQSDSEIIEIDKPVDLGQPITEPNLESQGGATEAPELPKGGKI
jgi:hypothetical protein